MTIIMSRLVNICWYNSLCLVYTIVIDLCNFPCHLQRRKVAIARVAIAKVAGARVSGARVSGARVARARVEIHRRLVKTIGA